jgi:putative membrane protein
MALKSIHELLTRRAMQLIAIALGAGRLETKVVGLDRIPQRGPAILVARHYHHLFDGVALYQVIPRHIHILALTRQNKLIRYFMETAIRPPAGRWSYVMTLRWSDVRATKEQRSPRTDRYQRKAMRDSIVLLVEGKALVIFPEGYRISIRTIRRRNPPKSCCRSMPASLPSLRQRKKNSPRESRSFPWGFTMNRESSGPLT